MKEVTNPAMKSLEGKTVARDRQGARQGRRRYVPRSRARRRSAHPVHDGAVQRERGTHPGVDQRPARDGRAVGWRRARRYVVRRRLLHLPARHLGARQAGDDASSVRSSGSPRSRPISSESRTAGVCCRGWPLISSCSIATPSARPSAARCATICPGGGRRHRDDGARHRARSRQRSDALRRRKTWRHAARPGPAFRQLLSVCTCSPGEKRRRRRK